MAKPFRAMPLFINNKKFGEITEASVKFMRNGEQQIGFEEVLGETEGVITSEITFKTVEPANGKAIDPDDLLLNNTYFSLGVLKGGKTYKIVDCMMSESTTASTSKSGVVTGDYSARGGKPQVI